MPSGSSPGVPHATVAVPLEVLEARLEALALRVTSLSLDDWVAACEVLCPELYGSPPASRVGLKSLPGSRTRRWRYAQRVVHGRAVHSPLDQTGPPVA